MTVCEHDDVHVPEALRTNHDAILGALGRHHLWSGYVHNWDDPWFDEVVAAILVLVGEKPLVYISASGSAAEIPDGSHEHLAVHVITDGALIVVSVGPADDTGAREISTRAVPLTVQSLAVAVRSPWPGRLSATVTVAGEQAFRIPSRHPMSDGEAEVLRHAIDHLARRVASDQAR